MSVTSTSILHTNQVQAAGRHRGRSAEWCCSKAEPRGAEAGDAGAAVGATPTKAGDAGATVGTAVGATPTDGASGATDPHRAGLNQTSRARPARRTTCWDDESGGGGAAVAAAGTAPRWGTAVGRNFGGSNDPSSSTAVPRSPGTRNCCGGRGTRGTIVPRSSPTTSGRRHQHLRDLLRRTPAPPPQLLRFPSTTATRTPARPARIRTTTATRTPARPARIRTATATRTPARPQHNRHTNARHTNALRTTTGGPRRCLPSCRANGNAFLRNGALRSGTLGGRPERLRPGQ